MTNSIYVALSKQTAMKAQMDVIANNIANMSTPGYRAQNMVFVEYLAETPGGPKTPDNHPLNMVSQYGDFVDTSPGTIQMTGNTLDVGLEGPGYFGIVTPDGTKYTRAGNFQMNALGELVTGTGLQVANSAGSAITIPEDARSVTIGSDGTIATEDGSVGQLMIVEFDNIQDLRAMGNGLYTTESNPFPSTDTVAVQGALERSNVNPIKEVTRMIEVSRAFQASQTMVESEHERERTMIQRMSRAG